MTLTTSRAVRTDDYPSRLGRSPELLPRQEPVIWGAEGGPLTAEQLRSFDTDGFVVVPKVFSRREIDGFDEALAGMIDGAGDDERVIREPESRDVRSIFQFHRRPGVLADVVGDPRLGDAARQILGSDVYVHQSRVNRKPGFRGKEFFWHSDFETWHTEDGMPRMRALSAVVSLTDNHDWNGPLMVMKGSHRWFVTCTEPTPPAHHELSLRRQLIGTPDDASLTDLYERGGITQCTGGAGSVIFFDCNLMHASTANITPEPRRNLFVVYNSVENTLVEPFSAPHRRPEHIAARDFSPIG